jgi:hypothetical protein
MAILFEAIKLKNQINQLRQKLIKVGKKKGLTHPETIKYSQDLDKLIIKFQTITLH